MSSLNTETSRRSFLKGAGAFAAATVAATSLAACSPSKPADSTKTDIAASINNDTPKWLGQEPEIDESEIIDEITTDLVIIGAGNGGMAASAYACLNGVDFQTFEVAAQPSSTRNWFAAVNTRTFANVGLTVDTELLRGEIARYSSGSADQRLVNMFINESNDMFEFVDSILAPLGGVAEPQDYNNIHPNIGGTTFYVPPFEHLYSFPKDAEVSDRNKAFEKVLNDNGMQVNYGHKLVKLTKNDEGRVTGAIFETHSGYVRAVANKAVLLATGGYVNNAQMLGDLSPITAKSCVMTTSEPNNDGTGQKAAMRAGAQRDYESCTMIFDRGWVDPGTSAGFDNDPDDQGAPNWPSNIQINAASQPFLKVNTLGERFMNESADYDYVAHAAAHMPNGTYFVIWDGNFGEDVNRFGSMGCAALTPLILQGFKKDDGTYDLDGFFKNPLQGDGKVLKADTLEELADKMLLDEDAKDTFLATVERYNEMYDNQEDEDFGKAVNCLSAVRKAPFYAASVGGRLLTSLDGIRINQDCQALGEGWKPIEGLYCCGDCSGSIFSGNYPNHLYGFAVGRTMTEALHVVKLVEKMN